MKILHTYVQNNRRKIEYSREHSEFNSVLEQAFLIYTPNCEVIGVSTNNENTFGMYMMEKPKNSPIDLSNVELDEEWNNLISFKIKEGVISAKVYSGGNKYNVDVGYPIVGTGEYVGEDRFTVYYVKDESIIVDGDSILNVTEHSVELVSFGFCCEHNFSATTFYADGSTSDESVYIWEENVSS